jgi:hypothetical protein
MHNLQIFLCTYFTSLFIYLQVFLSTTAQIKLPAEELCLVINCTSIVNVQLTLLSKQGRNNVHRLPCAIATNYSWYKCVRGFSFFLIAWIIIIIIKTTTPWTRVILEKLNIFTPNQDSQNFLHSVFSHSQQRPTCRCTKPDESSPKPLVLSHMEPFNVILPYAKWDVQHGFLQEPVFVCLSAVTSVSYLLTVPFSFILSR